MTMWPVLSKRDSAYSFAKSPSSPMGEYFENDFPVPVHENFQRIAFPDAQRPADFLRNDHPAQIVDAANDTSCFHSWCLAFM